MTNFTVTFWFLFLFFVYILLIFVLWLPWGFYIAVHMYCVLVLSCWSLNLKCILDTVHLYSPPLKITVFDIIFYICFVCPLTVYCEYRWFYYFCLLTFLVLHVDVFLSLWYVCLYQWAFPFCNFLVSSCFLFFSAYRSSFRICAALVVLNSFSFCLCVKLLISPSNPNESLAG